MTIAQKVLMVRPRSFRANEETIETNAFQSANGLIENASGLARDEFDRLHQALVKNGIEVALFEEPIHADTPDALFPNNWFASLPDGRAYLFPMMAINRRREVHPEWIKKVLPNASLSDLRTFEKQNIYLEGTGTLILDHDARVGYACYSPRSQKTAMEDFAKQSGYEIIGFDAFDANGGQYYHTNVIMALGSKLALLCIEAISQAAERECVLSRLQATGHEVVAITRAQVNEFAGNMIELANKDQKRFWICSKRAWQSLTGMQRERLQADATVIKTELPTIERLGGGGARCMIGELF